MSKSKAAFQFNAQEIGAQPVYLWTFTFREAMDVVDARKAWHGFMVLLRRTFPGIVGVRVFEMHKTHGLHVHMLTRRHLLVNDVRAVLARQYNRKIGRIHVVRADARAGEYLGKYLSKSQRPECLKRVRLWAVLDKKSFDHTRVKDVSCESTFGTFWGACAKAFGWTGNSGFWHKRGMVLHLMALAVISGSPVGFYRTESGELEPWAESPRFSDYLSNTVSRAYASLSA